MDCTKALRLSEHAALGTLSDVEQRQFSAHLAACAGCAEANQKLCEHLKGVSLARPEEHFPETRMQTMIDVVHAAVAQEAAKPARRSRTGVTVWAVAASLLVGVGGVWVGLIIGGQHKGCDIGSALAWSHAGFHTLTTSSLGAPAIAGNRAYTIRKTSSGDMIAALDLTGGSLVWSSGVSSLGHLAADQQRVYAISAELNHEGSLVALDAGSGAAAWRFVPPDNRGAQGRAVPAGDMVLWAAGKTLWSLNAMDGTVAWQADARDGFVSQPLFVLDRVLTVIGGDLKCLDLRDGSTVWSVLLAAESPVLARATLSFADNRLFVSHAGNDLSGHVTCVDAANGAVQWDRAALKAQHLVACGSMVYIRGTHVCGLDAATGEVLWRANAEGCSPIYCLHGSVVFADASREDALTVLDGSTGRPRAHIALPNACAGFVATTTSLGLVASNDGVLHAVDTRAVLGGI
jgi:outer membrane protein assembly factor BamB